MKRRAKRMKRIPFDREKMLRDRLDLIKERYRKLVLEPRKEIERELAAELAGEFSDDPELNVGEVLDPDTL